MICEARLLLFGSHVFNVSINFKNTIIIKYPEPADVSNHLLFGLLHTFFGN